MVFDNIGKDIDIYPIVGLSYNGEAIRVNFGHEPFKYDIEYHVQQQRNQTWAKILMTPLKLPSSTPAGDDVRIDSSDAGLRAKATIDQLVLLYLEHHGYAKTAKAFEAHCKRREGTSWDGASEYETHI